MQVHLLSKHLMEGAGDLLTINMKQTSVETVLKGFVHPKMIIQIIIYQPFC